MKSVIRKIISTVKAPAAIGPYNQGVLVNDTLYVSGSLGLIPESGEFAGESVTEQAEQSLKNIGAILQEAEMTYKNVVKTTVLLAHISDFAAVNEVYKKYFTENYPARVAYQAAALPKNALVEIDAIAVVGDIVDN